jgi:hypothetical protein
VQKFKKRLLRKEEKRKEEYCFVSNLPMIETKRKMTRRGKTKQVDDEEDDEKRYLDSVQF